MPALALLPCGTAACAACFPFGPEGGCLVVGAVAAAAAGGGVGRNGWTWGESRGYGRSGSRICCTVIRAAGHQIPLPRNGHCAPCRVQDNRLTGIDGLAAICRPETLRIKLVVDLHDGQPKERPSRVVQKLDVGRVVFRQVARDELLSHLSTRLKVLPCPPPHSQIRMAPTYLELCLLYVLRQTAEKQLIPSGIPAGCLVCHNGTSSCRG